MTGIAMPTCLPALHTDGRDGQKSSNMDGSHDRGKGHRFIYFSKK